MLYRHNPAKREKLFATLANLHENGLDGRDNMWILKPTAMNRGQGIRVAASLQDILQSCSIAFPRNYTEGLKATNLFDHTGPLQLGRSGTGNALSGNLKVYLPPEQGRGREKDSSRRRETGETGEAKANAIIDGVAEECRSVIERERL